MYDTRDLIKRNEKCLSCHLGDATKTVAHEMIAAGHPDLYFEILSFSAAEPRHWSEHKPGDPWGEFRNFVVGQAVQFREWLRRVERDASQSRPEYASHDCIACHHSSCLQRQLAAGTRLCGPHTGKRSCWNMSRFAVLETIVRQLDSGEAAQLDSEVVRLNKLVSDKQADRAQIAATANEASNTADRLAHTLLTVTLDPEQLRN